MHACIVSIKSVHCQLHMSCLQMLRCKCENLLRNVVKKIEATIYCQGIIDYFLVEGETNQRVSGT